MRPKPRNITRSPSRSFVPVATRLATPPRSTTIRGNRTWRDRAAAAPPGPRRFGRPPEGRTPPPAAGQHHTRRGPPPQAGRSSLHGPGRGLGGRVGALQGTDEVVGENMGTPS